MGGEDCGPKKGAESSASYDVADTTVRKLHGIMLGALVLAGLACVRTARAEGRTLRVTYAAPAGCSNRAAFVHEILLRTSRVRVLDTGDLPAPGDSVATIAVELADTPTAATATWTSSNFPIPEARRGAFARGLEAPAPGRGARTCAKLGRRSAAGARPRGSGGRAARRLNAHSRLGTVIAASCCV